VMSTASNSSCSALTSVTSALEVIFNVMRSINPRFTYLLTYGKLRYNTTTMLVVVLKVHDQRLDELLPVEAQLATSGTHQSVNQLSVRNAKHSPTTNSYCTLSL